MLLRLVLRLARRRIEGTLLGKEKAVTITTTIATKTTMITAAVAVGVLAAAGTATPTGRRRRRWPGSWARRERRGTPEHPLLAPPPPRAGRMARETRCC